MTRYLFEYAVLRVVPSIPRGEAINAGVVLYCQQQDYLGCRTHLDTARLAAISAVDPAPIAHALAAVVATCTGQGPAAGETPGRRFRWLTAPRSTVVQPGPIHTGLTVDPAAELAHLLAVLVLTDGS